MNWRFFRQHWMWIIGGAFTGIIILMWLIAPDVLANGAKAIIQVTVDVLAGIINAVGQAIFDAIIRHQRVIGDLILAGIFLWICVFAVRGIFRRPRRREH